MIKESKRKIVTYPFSGLDYSDIKEIGDRIYISGNEMLYLTSFIDKKYNTRSVKTDIITDEKLKGILYYFCFLNDLCRKYFNNYSIKCLSNNYDIPSFNTYIDTILITINEMVSVSKYNGTDFSFSDFFNSSLSSEYLSSVFDLLIDDSYVVRASKFRDNGVVFDKIMDGSLNSIVREIIKKKDNIMNVDIDAKNNKTVILKKVSRNKVI